MYKIISHLYDLQCCDTESFAYWEEEDQMYKVHLIDSANNVIESCDCIGSINVNNLVFYWIELYGAKIKEVVHRSDYQLFD